MAARWRRVATAGILGLAAGMASAAEDFLEGAVRSGEETPEAGVWVIAETDDLPTPFRKIVVTDEAGRFLLPELPEADYRVWVRGYGLRDSAAVAARPGGDALALQVRRAENEQEAAAIYPANHWLSLLHPPEGDAGWASAFKLGCQLCHQVGSAITRQRTREAFDLGLKKATFMHVTADALGRESLLDALADWSARIGAGETPPPPPRPQGLERNLVLTQWAWGDAFTYAHDEVATDKRDPTRYANEPIYGVDLANDRVLVLDPTSHEPRATRRPWCRCPPGTASTPPGAARPGAPPVARRRSRA